MVIACAEGGTSIEELAATNPDAIVKVPIDPGTGMTDENAAEIVAGLKCSGDLEAAKSNPAALWELVAGPAPRSYDAPLPATFFCLPTPHFWSHDAETPAP